MPIYEFHCEACDQDFEYLVFGKDQPVCPTCSGTNVNRIMSVCGFVSKGKGGETTRMAAGTSSCSGCTSTSCSSCH